MRTSFDHTMLSQLARTTSLASAIFVLATTAACSSPAAEGVPKDAANAANAANAAQVVFFDDFDGASLDRTKWNVEVWETTVNDEQQAYVDTSETIFIARGEEASGATNGVLVIRPRHRPGYVTPGGRRFDFLSGRLNTKGKLEFAYGTAAARMKLAAGPGLWPAFWALGTGDWPETGEIDIMENVGEPDWTSVALHGPGYSGDTPLFNRLYLPPGRDATSWHVYSVDWRPDGLDFRVDGVLVYRVTRSMVENYGRWSFDNPKFLILNLALGGAFPLKTNGVRTPYLGLPQATVELIQRDQARILVDWVKVTRN